MEAGLACKVLGCGMETVQEISDLFTTAEENDQLRNRIIERAEILKPVLMELQGQPRTVLPSTINALQKHLDNCKKIMSELDKRMLARPRDFLQSKSCHCQLKGLYDELSGAIETLNVVVSVTNLNNTADFEHFVKQKLGTLQQNIVNPHAGVYLLTSAIPRPHSAVLVTAKAKYDKELEETFLLIDWKDVTNNTDTVTEFEVQYDEQRGLSVRLDASRGPGVKLGKEKVQPGMLYTVRVRKINNSGPGPWSKSVVVHMPADPPSQPSQPRIELTSPTEGTLTVRRLSKEEEHGSPVTCLIIESCIQPSTEWISHPEVRIHPSNGRSIEETVTVEPNTTHYFRVRMRNSVGDSNPSEEVKLTPSQLIPGPPQHLKVVRRTDREIELQWHKPNVNPQAAETYQVQKQTNYRSWETISTTDRCSAVAVKLAPDTKYTFHVCAINSMNAKGQFGHNIESETKSSEKGHKAVVKWRACEHAVTFQDTIVDDTISSISILQ